MPLVAVAAAFFFAACGDSDSAHRDHAAPGDAEGRAVLESGVQVVQIDAGKMGFQPSEVEVRAGIPARIVITRTADSSCAEHIQIPDYGIERTELPLNEPVALEFTPSEEGSVTFVCGMDMQTGTIVVRS